MSSLRLGLRWNASGPMPSPWLSAQIRSRARHRRRGPRTASKRHHRASASQRLRTEPIGRRVPSRCLAPACVRRWRRASPWAWWWRSERWRLRWAADQRTPPPVLSAPTCEAVRRLGTAWRRAAVAFDPAPTAVALSELLPAASARPRRPRLRTRLAIKPKPPVSPASAATFEAAGHQLLMAGQYGSAIGDLRNAVSASGGSLTSCSQPTTEACLTYAYALYDLGRALALAGDPAAAVPVLRERLQIDNQREVVEQELDLARRAST